MRTSRRLLQVVLPGAMCLFLSAFGCGAGGKVSTSGVPTFDKARAWTNLTTQTGFGPRNPGSVGHEACRQWLLAQLQALSSDVTQQGFTYTTKDTQTALACANLIAVFGATPATDLSANGLLLAAHWDTRPVADQDPDMAKRDQAILGANDGASGVAVLLEVARQLHAKSPSRPVLVAFWDLEDSGSTPMTTGETLYGFCIGSRHFAANMGRLKPKESLLVDMIGDASPNYPREPNSVASNSALVDRVWSVGQALGFGSAFVNNAGPTMTDDHIPLIGAGVPSIDIIDFDYPGPNSNRYWHTTGDTPDHCDAESLRMVGQTLLQVIYGG